MGCCGNSYVPVGGQYTGGENNLAYQPPPTNPQWRVTYPNGAVLDFDHEWQAMQAKAMSGGTVEPINRDEPQPGEPGSDTGTTHSA